MNESSVIKENDFNESDIHEIDYLLDDTIKNCRVKYFRTTEYRLVYDNRFTNISKIEEFNFTITHRSIEFQEELYGFI